MDPVEILMHWLAKNYSKLILLAVVLIVAALIDKALTKVVRRMLDKSQVPNASIFVNILRVVVWVFAIGTLLQPVFGINPTTLFTALGIGGLAVSLGLKDTIANVIGGFGLMLGRVIQPGDYVKVAGITGTVKDINWRQTIVRERNGNEMVIPNSILNTASLEKLDPSNECLVSVPFTAKAGVDVERMKADIVSTVEHATVGLANPQYKPVVKLNGFTPYGIDGTIYAFAKNDLLLSTMADAVAQSIAHADYLEHRAVGSGVRNATHATQAMQATERPTGNVSPAGLHNPRDCGYRNRLIAVSSTVSTMNVIMPTLPYTVLAPVPRGSSSGAM